MLEWGHSIWGSPMGHKIRILLVDNHAMVRAGLRRILETDAGFQVAAEASDAAEAVNLLTSGLDCTIAVVDLALPKHDGVWLTRIMRERFAQVRILVLTMHLEEFS